MIIALQSLNNINFMGNFFCLKWIEKYARTVGPEHAIMDFRFKNRRKNVKAIFYAQKILDITNKEVFLGIDNVQSGINFGIKIMEINSFAFGHVVCNMHNNLQWLSVLSNW